MRWAVLGVLPLLFALGLWWELVPIPTSLNIVNALTDFVPAVFHMQRRLVREPVDSGHRKEFDFVVVGAGAAGSALATRLAEVGDWSVLLLEAGGEEVPVMTIPFLLSQFHHTDANWQFLTTRQNTRNYLKGRMVGGSTTINYMFNIRGNRRDFDNWEAMGNKGWSYKDVVPYFKKVEDLRIPELQNRENRGYGGRIRTTYPPYFSEDNKSTILDSNNENSRHGQAVPEGRSRGGLPHARRLQSRASKLGMHRIQTTTWHGARLVGQRRLTCARRARRHQPLPVGGRAATSPRWAGGRAPARGWRYGPRRPGVRGDGTKEVILLRGRLNTPAILLRFRIGRPTPQGMWLPLVKDLPVGLNLMDTQPSSTIGVLNETVAPSIPEIMLNPSTQMDYFTRRQGPSRQQGPSRHLLPRPQGTPHYRPRVPDVEMLHSSINAPSTRDSPPYSASPTGCRASCQAA
ncbi:Glucose dehydrogenase [FAD, quinone] [Gryllus bimaculatus]|nr:Glucose dehydrogenase [FAD, quinone] [Gryllus bimaculatus]